MKLLITGGCGFLGSNLALDAISRGDELWVFDNLYREGSQQNLKWLSGHGTFRFVHGDVRNPNDIMGAISECRPDAIFHVAGQVAMTTSIANPRMDFEINALGTFNLLEAVRNLVPDCIVLYSSTNKVYGDLEQFTYRDSETRYECNEKPLGFDESMQLEFHSPYGCSKGAGDQYMLDYARIYGMRTVVFRHSSMYGGRQYATYDQGWVGWFCQQAIRQAKGDRTPFTISGNGKQVRDVLHADDMKRLYIAAVEHIDEAQGHAFNVGGGFENSLSLLELFKLLESLVNTVLVYEETAPRESDQRVFIADIGKAIDVLQWAPQVKARAGVEKMLNWLQET